MKCSKCGEEVDAKLVKKEVTINFDNPGSVTETANGQLCKCGAHYTDEYEAIRLAKSIEAKRQKMHLR